MSRPILGLDFGSCALKAALYEGGKITRLLEEPMAENLIRGGAVTSPEAMAAFLKEFLKRNRISARKAAVILPASQVFVQVTQLPAMTEHQLKLNLPYEFRDFIPENRDQYFYDYALVQMHQNEDGQPSTMDLLCAAVSKELIHDYDNVCRWAGLKLVSAIPVEMAYISLLRRAQTLPDANHSREVFFIDCGHVGFRTYFFSGDRFETVRTGDLGGESVDQLLSDLLDTDVHIAHIHKETNQQGELARPEVRERFQEALRDVQRAVNFYHFSNPDRQLEAGFLLGGSSRVDYLRGELAEMAEVPLFGAADLLGPMPDEEKCAVCAAAIGAAIGQGGVK